MAPTLVFIHILFFLYTLCGENKNTHFIGKPRTFLGREVTLEQLAFAPVFQSICGFTFAVLQVDLKSWLSALCSRAATVWLGLMDLFLY